MNKDQKLIAEAYEEVVKNQETTFQPGDRVKIADTYKAESIQDERDLRGQTGTIIEPTVIKKSRGYDRKTKNYVYDEFPGYKVKLDQFFTPYSSREGIRLHLIDVVYLKAEDLIPV